MAVDKNKIIAEATKLVQKGAIDKAIATSVAGKNKDAAALFAHLGISLKDSSGHLKTVSELMPALADAFKNTSDPAMRVRMAMALFGKAGADMIPMLMEGSDALREFAEASKEVNYAPSDAEQKGIEDFHRGWIKLQAAVTGVTNAIGSKLAPVLAPVLAMATEWVVANRDWIATGIAAKVGELAAWIGKLHIQEIVDQMREWVATLTSTAEHVGGLKTMVGAAVLVLGSPLISAVTGVIAIMGGLLGVLKSLAVVAWANPIVAAVGLVAVAAYEIYQHWEPIKAFFVDLWAGIKTAFSDAWAYISPIVDKVKAAADFIAHNAVTRAFSAAVPSNDPIDGVSSWPMPSATELLANGTPGKAGASGETHVKIDMTGVPAGTKVTTETKGAAQTPELSVGYATPAFAY